MDGGKYEIIHEGNTHILIVHDVYGEDADEYSAKVVNRAGSRTSRGDLLIRCEWTLVEMYWWGTCVLMFDVALTKT